MRSHKPTTALHLLASVLCNNRTLSSPTSTAERSTITRSKVSRGKRAECRVAGLHLRVLIAHSSPLVCRCVSVARIAAGGLIARFTGGCSSSSSSSLPSSSAFSGVLSCAEVDLDDLSYAETAAGEGVYSHACRCGSAIVACERDLESGIDLFSCDQCSIVIRVAFEWRPAEGQKQAAAAEEDDPPVAATDPTATASDAREMD